MVIQCVFIKEFTKYLFSKNAQESLVNMKFQKVKAFFFAG